jgi:hypothetical protein
MQVEAQEDRKTVGLYENRLMRNCLMPLQVDINISWLWELLSFGPLALIQYLIRRGCVLRHGWCKLCID